MDPPQHNVSQTEPVLQPLQQKIVIDAVERCGEVQERPSAERRGRCDRCVWDYFSASKWLVVFLCWNRGKTEVPCLVSRDCWRKMTDPRYHGYSLTHEVFYLEIAEAVHNYTIYRAGQ